MKLSFAHAEGRNYRQLPAKARLREKPSPADIVYSKRYALSKLECKWRDAFFATGVTSPKVTRVSIWALAADEMGGKPERSPHVLEFCGCMRSEARGLMEHFLLGPTVRLPPVVPYQKVMT